MPESAYRNITCRTAPSPAGSPTIDPVASLALLRLPTGIFYAQGVKANVLFFDRMARADLDEFVACYNPANRNQRKPTWDEQDNPEGRWRVFTYGELVARDKCSLDIFWLKDHSLEDSANLPDPDVLAAEIAEDLRSALEQIENVLADLQQRRTAISQGTESA